MEKSEEQVDLSHIMRIDLLTSTGHEVILYNSNFVDENTALEVFLAGGHSNYVLHLSKKHFEALFLNKECDDTCLLV